MTRYPVVGDKIEFMHYDMTNMSELGLVTAQVLRTSNMLENWGVYRTLTQYGRIDFIPKDGKIVRQVDMMPDDRVSIVE